MILSKLNKKITLGLVALSLLVAISVAYNLPQEKEVRGEDGDNSCTLSAWAWSGYKDLLGKWSGIGWTSFTSENQGDSIKYEVTVDKDTGLLTGWVWSPSIGWIKFGGLSGFPAVGEDFGVADDNAKFDSVSKKLTGWVRACSVFASGCSGTTKPDTLLGGWDGWIALSGVTSAGVDWGVTFNSDTEEFTGWGWGGDKVVGRFEFDNVGYAASTCEDSGDFEFQINVLPSIITLNRPTDGDKSKSTSVYVATLEGTSEEVHIESIELTRVDPDNCSFGVCEGIVELDWDDSESCDPGDSGDLGCDLDLSVNYNLRDYNFEQTLTYEVTVESISGIRDTDILSIRIPASDQPSLTCEATPNPVFRKQAVEWSLEARNLEGVDSYLWSGHNEVNGKIETSFDLPSGYDSQGVKSAKVSALDVNGNPVIDPAECELRVLPDIYFDHI